jgi:hypothetical protein
LQSIAKIRRQDMWSLRRDMEELEDLISDLVSSGDADKSQRGNVSAGRRIRVGLQEIKNKAQEIRVAILEDQKGRKGKV